MTPHKDCKEATDKLLLFLPASFALLNNTNETFGVSDLELNPDIDQKEVLYLVNSKKSKTKP
jgi:hypothetical protein